MKQRKSVFNWYEQRVYGLVHIAQGVAMVVVGKYAHSWTLKYAKWGAIRASRRQGLIK